MKTYANNAPVLFDRLTLEQHNIVIAKMAEHHDLREHTMRACVAGDYDPDVDFEFYPLNNDVAVKNKR